MDIFFYAVIPGMVLGGLLLSIALGIFAVLRYAMLPSYKLKLTQRREAAARTLNLDAARSLLSDLIMEAQTGRAAIPQESQDRIYEILSNRKQLR